MRKILNLNQNWQFALQKPGMEKEGLLFTQVTLPHDWMISCPFDRNMKQGEAQGFFDRWGTGWYRRTLLLEKKPELLKTIDNFELHVLYYGARKKMLGKDTAMRAALLAPGIRFYHRLYYRAMELLYKSYPEKELLKVIFSGCLIVMIVMVIPKCILEMASLWALVETPMEKLETVRAMKFLSWVIIITTGRRYLGCPVHM